MMCGIYASVSKTHPIRPEAELRQSLCRRGPDHLGEIEAYVNTESGTLSFSFTSTVLALRGGRVAIQPLIDSGTGSVLCWNGEAWKIGHEVVEGNDGEAILALLSSHTPSLPALDSVKHVIETLQNVSGPFAFIFFDKIHNLLYFGRDCLGRRSLLYNVDSANEVFQFSSVASDTEGPWREVESDGIYVMVVSKVLDHHSLMSLLIQDTQFGYLPTYHTNGYLIPNQQNSRVISEMNLTLPLEPCYLDSQTSSVKELELQLLDSLKLRVLNIPNPQKLKSLHETKLAILFSGGLDCTVLAYMAHNLLAADDQIDLLNVAFENPRVVKAANTSSNKIYTTESTDRDSAYESCPDRISGRKALGELRQLCPGRIWRFVAINVPYTETMSHRNKVVQLMYPHKTEMDLSISYALYFAARGSGLASTGQDESWVEYTTPARVLLSGLGADELFGGYTRHATAFERRGFPSLLSELELDVRRLGKRNLGRDDRIIANWGREARYPYLDESLVNWALKLSVWSKCGFGTTSRIEEDIKNDLEPGKKVLRLLARKLGLISVAVEKKRAVSNIHPLEVLFLRGLFQIQFGARTAKMETSKTKGTSQIV